MTKEWDRRDTESQPAWEAFQTYRDQGQGRTLEAVATACKKSASIMGRWSGTHEWVARAAAWDAHLDQAVQEKLKAGRLKRVQQQQNLGRNMQALASAGVARYFKTVKDPKAPGGERIELTQDLRLGELAALAKAGFEIERVAGGEEDSRVGVNVTMAGATRARLDELFGDKEVKKKEEGANGHA